MLSGTARVFAFTRIVESRLSRAAFCGSFQALSQSRGSSASSLNPALPKHGVARVANVRALRLPVMHARHSIRAIAKALGSYRRNAARERRLSTIA